ncbi:MAG: PH domain-containing protein, partial [Bdellovibrionales bacterium]|nr:PH domain-containing protein [Bdellovibrionales bacterium]
YEHIRGVELDRTLYQRMFNLGDIKIGSSMKNEIEVLIRGIYKPDYYKRIIEYRLRLHMESRQSLL